jgi:hypothetical protein
MLQTVKYLPTGQRFGSKSEAKKALGHENYERAYKEGNIVIITTYSPFDVILP